MYVSNIIAPFDAALNDAVLKISSVFVPDFTVSDDAPSTYHSLKKHMDSGAQMVVASEGSAATIFGSAEVNYAYRAWHDWTHWKTESDFSLQGEMETCCCQLQHIQRFYGISQRTCYWRDLIVADIVGQRRYYEVNHTYVTDQRAFTLAYLQDPNAALTRRW